MVAYSDADIDAAIARIAADVARRSDSAEFPSVALDASLEAVRQMEAARRSGDALAAATFAQTAQPVLAEYRPTNATSRSKAVLVEVLAAVLSDV